MSDHEDESLSDEEEALLSFLASLGYTDASLGYHAGHNAPVAPDISESDQEVSDEEEILAQFCSTNLIVSSGRSSACIRRTEACPQNSFGKRRRVSEMSQASSGYSHSSEHSFRTVEDEPLPEKLNIIRGKLPRKTKKIRQHLERKKSGEYMKANSIAAALVPCCSNNCYRRFTFEDINSERKEFWALHRNRQADWLTRELCFWGTPAEDTGVFKFKYTLQEKTCCSAFLKNALPISHARLCKIRKRVLSSRLEDCVTQARMPNGKKAEYIEQFIRKYAQENGGGMPHNNDVELPNGVTKDSVYIEYLLSFPDEQTETKESAVLSYFYKVWRARCYYVKSNKWTKFSKCSVCSNIKTLREFCQASKFGESSNCATHDSTTFLRK